MFTCRLVFSADTNSQNLWIPVTNLSYFSVLVVVSLLFKATLSSRASHYLELRPVKVLSLWSQGTIYLLWYRIRPLVPLLRVPSNMATPQRSIFSSRPWHARIHQNHSGIFVLHYPSKHFQLWYLYEFTPFHENIVNLKSFLSKLMQVKLRLGCHFDIYAKEHHVLNQLPRVAWPAIDRSHQWTKRSSWWRLGGCIGT